MSKCETSRQLSALAIMGAVLSMSLGCAQQTPAPSSKPSMARMNTMDANKDGAVSKDEFMKYWEQKFDSMDKDKTGKITQQEWLQHQLSETDGSF